MVRITMFALLGVALCANTQQRVNPVEKVTALLSKLQSEVEAEGKSEAAAYDKFACFCKEQADNKQYAIEKFIEQENVLDGKIEQKDATKTQLDSEIVEHNTEIKSLEAEHTAAAGVRKSSNEAYLSQKATLSKAVSALKNAIEALQASKGDMKDSKDGYTLLSEYTETITNALAVAGSLKLSKGADLTRLLQQPDTAHAYSYHSNEVVQTLNALLVEFKQKVLATDNDERSDRQEFEMVAGARRNQITALQKAASEKSEASAALEEEINDHRTDLAATKAAHAADSNFLSDLTAKCETKSQDFDQRSSTRAAELQAISSAIELLKNDVSKMYPSNKLGLVVKSKLVKPAPPAAKAGGHWEWVAEETAAPKKASAKEENDESDDSEDDAPVSFLQVDRPAAAARKKLVAFLTSKAQSLKSTTLNTLLLKLRDAPSPFAKVKSMIMDMITRLEAEAADEASQKEWCDEQMTSTTEDRDEAQTKIESLNAFSTEKHALVDQLTEEIGTLGQQIADLQKAINEATEIRTTEKATNEQTIADAEAGEAAVAQAKSFLEEFYSGAAPSFLQQAPAAEGYERFSAENAGSDGKTVGDLAPDAGGVEGEYHGNQDASKSIIGLLSVIESDFINSQTNTDSEEKAAATQHATFTADAEADIDSKTDLKSQKADSKEGAELDITKNDANLKTQHEMLQNALDELEKLKPVCVDTGMSWEERKARREQEVEALKSALDILRNTDFGF